MAGGALSFSMFCVGLLLSSNPDAAGDLVQVPSMLFQGSLLLGLISRATLGYRYAFLNKKKTLLRDNFFMISYLIPVENQTDNSLKRRYTVLCQRVNSSFGWHFSQVDPTFKCLAQSPWIPLWMCQRTPSSQILDLIISFHMDHLKVNGPHLISKVRQYAAKIV